MAPARPNSYVPPKHGLVVHVAEAVAVAELVEARRLAWILPESTTIEEHWSIGESIGECGRRCRIILESTTDNALDLPAPPLDGVDSGESSFQDLASVYHSARKELDGLGVQASALCRALKAAQAILPTTKLPSRNAVAGIDFADLMAIAATTRHDSACVRHGNPTKRYDPHWRILGPTDVLPRMLRIEHPTGLAQKLHHTAFREPVATEIAALNLSEMDCMPWLFYVDMARQSEDEAKHTELCVTRLRELGHDLGSFPLPYFGNYYQMFFDMTPAERFVAMNLDTEAEGQVYLAEVASRLAGIGDDASAELFAVLGRDEQRHARFGAKWLTHLYPDTQQRQVAIDAARRLLPMHLAAAHSELTGEDADTALERWINTGRVLNYAEPISDQHEHEISLVTGRHGGRKGRQLAAVGG
jgi:uncharacterized ferritin-like protein (DUF455 family)